MGIINSKISMGVLVGVLVLVLLVLIPFCSMVSDVIHVCDDENLETKVITVENKFTTRTGFLGSSDRYHFLDEDGTDYVIWGEHSAVRYVKLELNQTYQIKVNVKNENIVCKEVLNGSW